MYLLDTNIISLLFKDGISKDAITAKMNHYSRFSFFISSITYFEIEFGIQNALIKFGKDYKTTQFEKIRKFLSSEYLLKLSLDEQVATEASHIKARLIYEGITISDPDIFIASTALCHNLTLVTHNTKNYVKINTLRPLKIEDWTQ